MPRGKKVDKQKRAASGENPENDPPDCDNIALSAARPKRSCSKAHLSTIQPSSDDDFEPISDNKRTPKKAKITKATKVKNTKEIKPSSSSTSIQLSSDDDFEPTSITKSSREAEKCVTPKTSNKSREEKDTSKRCKITKCTQIKSPKEIKITLSPDDDFKPISSTPQKGKITKEAKEIPSSKSNKIQAIGENPVIPKENISSRKVIGTMQTLTRFESGVSNCACVERMARHSVISQLSEFAVYKSVTPFDRRTTALAWHPKHPNLCAVGSKGGDLLVWRHDRDDFDGFVRGIGPGGSIQKILFDVQNPDRLFTCSIEGTFEARNFKNKGEKETFLSTHDWSRWYTSFDVSVSGAMLLTGENNGYVTLLSAHSGQQVWRDKLHKAKVTDIQFSPREPWLIVTTSVDNTVKVWDIRTLTTDSRKQQVLQTLNHVKAVNCASFNNVDGTRLLTTDQNSQLRVYRGPHWDLERIVPHPHRQFQHLTPIKAVWHPLVDLVIAGRYPDEKFPGYVQGERRSIDVMDPDTGQTLLQMTQPGMNKIVSLNQFSPMGDTLLSGMGQTVVIWKQKFNEEKYEEKKMMKKDGQHFVVEEWPGYKPQSKGLSRNKKKLP